MSRMTVPWRDGVDVEEASVNKELTEYQKQELQELLQEYKGTLTSTPGITTLTKHHINVGQSPPVILPPYCLPHAYRDLVQKELEDMECSGAI